MTKTSKHTPGPWVIDEDVGDVISITCSSRVGMVEIASVEAGFDAEFEAEQLANARLIVAAPDMLAALKPFADLGVGSGPGYETETYRITRDAIRSARSAIAKARGE